MSKQDRECKSADFHQFIWNSDDWDTYPTDEDIKYIIKQFIKAVVKRKLVCSGVCKPTQKEING